MTPKARLLSALAIAAAISGPAIGQTYDIGATDTEVKIGQTKPYSGPASSYGVGGTTWLRYFDMINEAGGINNRKIVLLSEDDGYSPPKTVELVRRLIERDEVLFLAGNLGTATNTAILDYVNDSEIPHLLVGSGSSKFNDMEGHPWTMAFTPNYHTEGRTFGAYIAKEMPEAKVGILYQNDDSGKDILMGLEEVLAENGISENLVVETSYESTDPTVDSQIIAMQSAGVEVIVSFGLPRITAQVIRKKTDIGYDPVILIGNVGSSVESGLAPAGKENAVGVITDQFLMDPADPDVQSSEDFQEFAAFMDKWYPEGDKTDLTVVQGYVEAKVVEQIIRQAGDELTRENILKQARSLDTDVPMLLEGIRVNTSDTDNLIIDQAVLAKFDGEKWVPFGGVLGGSD